MDFVTRVKANDDDYTAVGLRRCCAVPFGASYFADGFAGDLWMMNLLAQATLN